MYHSPFFDALSKRISEVASTNRDEDMEAFLSYTILVGGLITLLVFMV